MKNKTKKTTPNARVTSISVSRLFNLGNYENVKYDIAAELPEGTSAKAVLLQLASTVWALGPIRTPHCRQEYEDALKKVDAQRSNYEKEHMQEWQERMAAYHTKVAARAQAVEELDNLGATSTRKDAKNTWDDPDDDY